MNNVLISWCTFKAKTKNNCSSFVYLFLAQLVCILEAMGIARVNMLRLRSVNFVVQYLSKDTSRPLANNAPRSVVAKHGHHISRVSLIWVAWYQRMCTLNLLQPVSLYSREFVSRKSSNIAS